MTQYQVVLNGMQDAEPMLTVLNYDITGSTDFQLLADAIDAEIEAGLADLIVPSCSWTGITIRLDSPGSVGVTYAFTGGVIVGQNAGTAYVALAAANVRKLTAGTTRPTQGRIYQGGIPVPSYDADGKLTGSYVNSMTAAWENLRVIEFDTTGEAVMQIKASNPSAPNTSPYNVVASLETAGRISSQKRRNYNT